LIASIAKDASRSLILYTVGPATSRSLTTLRDTHLPHASIYGSDAGDGQRLALAILEHYNALYDGDGVDAAAKPPLLFLVGEQRRDIIPRTLMAESLPSAKRIRVDELVVYETGVMESFEGDFRAAVRAGREYLAVAGGERVIWVVVFSPTGCDAMLRVLGLLSTSTGSSAGGAGALVDEIASGTERRVFVATIGPTTRDHLIKNYGFEPDVCAEKPSQEGVGAGIEAFMRRRREESSSRA
jgi:uroporphyrinogen-III synthase